MTRPSALQYIGYSFGRKLPDELREWVRYDLTCDRALARHLVRSAVPFIPVFVGILLIPLGPLWLRGLCVLLALGETVIFSFSFMPMNRERRLLQHGYPGDLDRALNHQRQNLRRQQYERTYRNAA